MANEPIYLLSVKTAQGATKNLTIDYNENIANKPIHIINSTGSLPNTGKEGHIYVLLGETPTEQNIGSAQAYIFSGYHYYALSTSITSDWHDIELIDCGDAYS